MEVWALEAYGAAHTLRNSDSEERRRGGRVKTYEAIIKGKTFPNRAFGIVQGIDQSCKAWRWILKCSMKTMRKLRSAHRR
ncbi:MAG: hypothetical protein ACLT0Y_03905 [Christensenellales bacterium]